jgi:hypothetical protein
MHRTHLTLITTLLAAAALAVPGAYAGHGSPHRVAVGEGFSLGVPDEYLAQPNQLEEGFSLGVPEEYLAPSPTVVATGANGFDWTDAGIGAATVAGLLLLLGVLGTIIVRARRPHGRLSST